MVVIDDRNLLVVVCLFPDVYLGDRAVHEPVHLIIDGLSLLYASFKISLCCSHDDRIDDSRKFRKINLHHLICGQRMAALLPLSPVHVVVYDCVHHRHANTFGIEFETEIGE
ncbi:MAG: hypothetical protein C5S52_07825 [ANME-2 cluster archaeon]|nr:hypothetical protein [ANME-2 cluster archaeon]